ncbi:hypothetical protein M8C21_031397 [Ambrosia artemisiifolia]|uniref:Uncharacterized protein n=1 Tax=Ambrosia artemisiifolia TaxID=4212 RepID=A0AAD5CIK9_AMBAR|nr:hypothetical protein M8C21_031397 [Ambrosia artemisiifolia]
MDNEKSVGLTGAFLAVSVKSAFDDEDHPYLPKVTDKMTLNAPHIYPHNTLQTKEAYYYRMIFERDLNRDKAIEWDAAWSNHLESSGRAAFGGHNSAYELNRGPDTNATKIVEGEQMMMDTAVPELTIRS